MATKCASTFANTVPLLTASLMSSPTESSDQASFIGTLLEPGSSLNPVFLNILDAAFVALLLVFVILAFVTAGNPHIFVLAFIELVLWASVKWYVYSRL